MIWREIAMRLPQDLANLLAVAVRDVIWYKRGVYSFLRECGVPEAIMVEVEQSKSTPTIKIVHEVLDQLNRRGDEGERVVRELLTRMYYWQDMHTVSADRKDQALASLQALRTGYKKYTDRQEQQRRQEREMQREREKRRSLKTLDHDLLRKFRDEFDGIFALPDRQERGNRFQDLMNRIFNYYCDKSRGAFNRRGEQIDGLFYFDTHWWFVEVRWKEEKASAADVSVLRDRARDAYGGDTKALFISFNGFSDDCLVSLAGRGDERVILMDGYDLRCVLDCHIAFDVLLAEKQAEIVQSKRAFIGVQELLERKKK
jgi:hypothetical protein